MKKFPPLTRLAAIVLFWVALFFVFLSPNDDTPATPQAKHIEGKAVASQSIPSQDIQPPPIISALPAPEPTPFPVRINYVEKCGELRPGEGLDDSLKRCDIPTRNRLEIIRALSETLDMRKLRPGAKYTITMDETGDFFKGTYEVSPIEIYDISRTGKRVFASRKEIPLEQRTTRITGRIESSVFLAFTGLGEEAKLIHAFADIFASKVDFNTEPRAGDTFEVVVDKYYKDSLFVGYGKIRMARYVLEKTVYEGYYFASQSTPATRGYFDPAGKELGTSFLRSPIPFGRVTSGFSRSRRHPILGTRRPHLGVDLAAPTGTPIMAASDGRVRLIGRNGGYGKQVVLDHANGYRTHYGHLSRFKKGLRKGDRVKQKDIIGYVGSTGLSTGPHLDYRIQDNGVFKNPFSLKFKPRSVLKGEDLEAFAEVQQNIARQLMGNESNIISVKNLILSDRDKISLL